MKVLRGEAGETLIEIMMTVAIVSIAMVSIITGIGAAMRFSALNRDSANVGLALLEAAAAVKAMPIDSASCDPSTYEDTIGDIDLPSGWSLSVPDDAACEDPVEEEEVQIVTVTVVATSVDGPSKSLEVTRWSLA